LDGGHGHGRRAARGAGAGLGFRRADPAPASAAGRARRAREIAAPYGPETTVFLLDTHVWLRLLLPELGRLPAATTRILQEAQRAGQLTVSDISIWGLAMRVGRGSLQLAMPLRDWLERAMQAPGIRHAPINRAALLRAHETETGDIGDPFDRALIATDLTGGSTLVTADQAILRWGATSGVPMLSAR
jgi:PIN domain nuclease of toxin-antitoxin system